MLTPYGDQLRLVAPHKCLGADANPYPGQCLLKPQDLMLCIQGCLSYLWICMNTDQRAVSAAAAFRGHIRALVCAAIPEVHPERGQPGQVIGGAIPALFYRIRSPFTLLVSTSMDLNTSPDSTSVRSTLLLTASFSLHSVCMHLSPCSPVIGVQDRWSVACMMYVGMSGWQVVIGIFRV